MRFLLLLLTALLPGIVTLSAQSSVQGKVVASDTARIQVIRIFPDSFPRVDVVFKASSPSGQPLWNLDTTNTKIEEDGKATHVVSVKKISVNTSINSALVIDHSGSMNESEEIRNWMNSLPPSAFVTKMVTRREYTKDEVDSDELMAVRYSPPIPDNMHYPIWYAQRAATSFVNSTDAPKDAVSIVGFSDKVDNVLPLTKNHNDINYTINSLSAVGGTAFYDAVNNAIRQVEKADGIRVVIAMTDGQDNLSQLTLSSVIANANRKHVPVYVIGLGDVDKKGLRKLANQTGGRAYFTNDASQLSSIYLDISREIQSVYELVYTSNNLAAADSSRDIVLQFDIDGAFHHTRTLDLDLPAEVVAHLHEREQQANAVQVVSPSTTESSSPWPYIAGISVAVVGAGVLVARSSKKRQQQQQPLWIERLYPNPANGPVTLETNRAPENPACTLLVSDMNGQLVLSLPFTPGNSFDTSVLQNGTYLVQVQSSTTITPAKQLVINR